MSNDTNTAGEHSAAWDRAMKAVGDKDTEALRTLVAARPGLAQEHDSDGNTLLHLAAWANADRCAEVLLTAGAAIDAVNADSDMPHHNATMNNCPKTLSLLLAAGAPVDARGWSGTALDARTNDDDSTGCYGLIVQLLLDFGADPNLDSGEYSNSHNAFFLNSQEYVALLLDYGAFFSRGNAGGWVENMDNLLLDAADDFVKDQVMLYLIEQGANISARDAEGRTPLHLVAGSTTAYQSPEFAAEFITDLVRLGADASAVASDGRTALDMAGTHDEMPDIEAILIEAARDAETPWRRAWHALLSADIERLARTLDAHPELARTKDADGNTLLHLAPHDGGAAIRLLVELDADIEARNATGETPLFNAVRHDRTDTTLGAHKSATESSTDVLTVMGASLHARRKGGVTPLHVAAEFSRTRFLRSHLAEDGCFCSDTAREGLSAQDDAGRTPLHHAACAEPRSVRRIATMNLLVRAGADPDLPDKVGDSPAALAWRGYPLSELQRASLDHLSGMLRGGHLRVEEMGPDGRMPLHRVAANGAILAVQMLLMYGADIEGGDAEGRTPLDLAMQSGKEAAARYLLNAGAESEELRPRFFHAPPERSYGVTTVWLEAAYQSLKAARGVTDAVQGHSEQNGLEGDEDDGEEGDLSYLDQDQDWNGPIVGGGYISGIWREHGIETGAKWNGGSDDE